MLSAYDRTTENVKPSGPSNEYRKQPLIAVLSCRDSAAHVAAILRSGGTDPQDVVILSRVDHPSLRTIDDMLAAVPPHVRWVVLADVDELLPDGQKTKEDAATMVEAARLRLHRTLAIIGIVTHPGGRK
jgi:hypothetical protein